METNLRPLSLGEILDRTAQLYRSHFLLFAGISSVYAGVILVLSLLQIGAQELLTALHWSQYLIWATGLGMVILFLAIFITGGVAVAANNRAVGWVHLGEPATIRDAYGSILPRIGRYLWLMAITTFIVWVPCLVIYGAYAVFIFAYLGPKGLSGAAGSQRDAGMMVVFGVVTLAFVVLLLAALVYAIVMALRYSLAVPACVVENLKARAAIRRSIELSKGSRWRILMLWILAIVIQVGLIAITEGFFFVYALKNQGTLPIALRILQQVIAFFTTTFVGPIYATGMTLFYYDQRVRKEGYDIERMMQTSGLSEPVARIAPATGPEFNTEINPQPNPDTVVSQEPESTHE